jgi:uncharacterized membrane protein YfcA
MDWAHTFSGFGVGMLVGLTGVGGGSLMAPILILLFGYLPATAVGTDLWFAGITKAFGGYVHHRQGGVDKQVLTRLLLGSLPAAFVTLLVLQYTGFHQIKDGVIIHTLGFVLILTAIATLFRHRFIRWSRSYQRKAGHDALNIQLPLTIAAGIFLGTMVTLTSVGAGALGVTMILCLYPLRMHANRLVATDIVHAIPLTILAGMGYAFMGKVDVALLFRLLIGSIPGIIIGSLLTKHIPEAGLRVILAIVLVLVGIKMFLT